MKITENERKKVTRHVIREKLIAERLENLRKEKAKEAYLEYLQEKAMKPYTKHK